ncbi:MAG: class I SAM-dependent methyltransferase [Candidatus Riflebacteria bacterium]|nr:class I SAM-dependent methyltransferase [Candidatus Riflebacteria bacterium]
MTDPKLRHRQPPSAVPDRGAASALAEDARLRFEALYERQASWDVDGPQPAIVGLVDSGQVRGVVLDVGCGTGENALYAASKGLETWGLDIVGGAIMTARAKARARGLPAARFLVGDALALAEIGMVFDTVIDSGLFHALSDPERPYFVVGLAEVLRPGGRYHLLGFSEHEPRDTGPRRLTREEIRATFERPWNVISLEETRFLTRLHQGGARAWIATIELGEGSGC